MKGTFSFLLLVVMAVAMGNCQNPYGQYEIRKPVPEASRTPYAYSYPVQRIMESGSTPSAPIRISFSGLSEISAAKSEIRNRYGQQQPEEQSGEQAGEFQTGASRSSSSLPVPILMPTSQGEQQQQPIPMPVRPPPSAAAQQQQQNRPPQVRPPPQNPIIPIIRFNQEIQEGVVNRFDFEAANGIKEEEETDIIHLDGGARNRNAEDQYNNYPAYNYGYDGKNYDDYYDNVEIVKKGKYSYYSPEGEHIEVSWIADKDGFRPVGSHIPTAVPALKQNEPAPFPSSFQMVPGRRQPY